MDRKAAEAALKAAQEAQTAFWDAMGELESVLGIELHNADALDLSNQTIDSLLELDDEW